MPNAAAAAVSTRLRWHGPCETITTACAAGTHAIGHAARLVASGECDVVLAGGTEAAITPTVVAGFANMRALSRAGRTRPFDINRDGFAIAEGAAVLVLEDWDAAHRRGARIYGEILGSASTADAYDITKPDPNGTSVVNCIQKVLAAKGLDAAAIHQINAHGTGTALNDTVEAKAIRTVFNSHHPAVTSTKGATGHALGAAGALEAVAVLLSMYHQVIPPTLGLETPDTGCDLDLITGDGRPWHPAPALSFSFGFGGHNGVLALGPADLAMTAT
jgi:3-oxoacyl-[acyl-carrier-protein] synthase II